MKRKPFTRELQERVAARIDGVPASEPVTWEHVRTFAAETGVTVTRQWLNRSAVVREAYRRHVEATKRVRCGREANTSVPSEVDTLKEEVRRLTKMVEDSDHRFVRWLYNAKQKGLSVEHLEKPVPELES